MKYLVIVRHGIAHQEGDKFWLDYPEGGKQMNRLGERLKPVIEGITESRIGIFCGNSPHLLHSAHQLCPGLGIGADRIDFLADLVEDEDEDAPRRVLEFIKARENEFDVMILVTRKNLTKAIFHDFHGCMKEKRHLGGAVNFGELENGEAYVAFVESGFYSNKLVNYKDPEHWVLEWITDLGVVVAEAKTA